MQSDTVIGIVGAVVLVAVMVGVFAYEYNNTPETENPDSEEAQKRSFNESALGFLAADEDIDNDGLANWEDDDVDGDGIANDEDTDVKVAFPVDGTAAANTSPTGPGSATNTPFKIGQGAQRLHVTLTSGTGTTGTARISCSVSGIDGASGSGDASGACEFEADGGVAAGSYQLAVRQTQLNPQAVSFSGEIHIVYA